MQSRGPGFRCQNHKPNLSNITGKLGTENLRLKCTPQHRPARWLVFGDSRYLIPRVGSVRGVHFFNRNAKFSHGPPAGTLFSIPGETPLGATRQIIKKGKRHTACAVKVQAGERSRSAPQRTSTYWKPLRSVSTSAQVRGDRAGKWDVHLLVLGTRTDLCHTLKETGAACQWKNCLFLFLGHPGFWPRMEADRQVRLISKTYSGLLPIDNQMWKAGPRWAGNCWG